MGVVSSELRASGLNRELPVNLDCLRTSLIEQRQHFAAKALNRRDSSIQTLARDHRELTFDHIQPTGSLGCIVKLEALRERECLPGTQMLVKRACVMCVEIVQYQ